MVTHFKRLILSVFLVASFVGVLVPQTALADTVPGITSESECKADDKDNQWVADSTEPNGGHCDTAGPKSSCEIDGVGWVVCPALKFMGKLNDAAFGIINDFLEVQPALLADDGARVPWEQFRNIANIAFVITFVVIIYSQITGAGVTNYGIKKLLPKIIVAAILVNISYYLCQIAVDVSNIIGHSIYGFFKDIPTTNADGSTDFVDAAGNTLSWENVITGALAAAGIILVAVLLAMSMGSMALLAFVLVVVILLARKAIIILLIVVSPLAFVAYLLPNTEKWFKKWSQLFGNLLMVYPIIGAIFGASYLTARIISNTATSSDDDQTLLQLTALGISAVPLFAIPAVLKGGMAATGAIGAKLSGGLDRATGAMGKQRNERIKRRGENIESRMAASERKGGLGSAMRYAGGYRARRDFGHKSMEIDTARRQEDALARHVLAKDDQGNYIRNYGDRERTVAQATVEKRRQEGISDAKASLSNLQRQDIVDIAMGKTQATAAVREAAISTVGPTFDSREALDLAESVGGADLHVRQAAVDAVAGKSPLTSGAALGNVEAGTFSRFDTILGEFDPAIGKFKGGKIRAGDISAEWLATKAKPADIEEIATTIAGVADQDVKKELQSIVDEAVAKIAATAQLSSAVVAGTDRDVALRKLSGRMDQDDAFDTYQDNIK